jgi:hypothetical protein
MSAIRKEADPAYCPDVFAESQSQLIHRSVTWLLAALGRDLREERKGYFSFKIALLGFYIFVH